MTATGMYVGYTIFFKIFKVVDTTYTLNITIFFKKFFGYNGTSHITIFSKFLRYNDTTLL